MDKFDAVQSIENFSKLSGLGAAIGIALLIFFVWRRTRSTHSLMARLWRLSEGKDECSDKRIEEFLKTRSALMQFRFTTGAPIRLHSQIAPLLDWSEKNKEDIGDIVGCGPYFDFEKLSLNENKMKGHWYLTALIVFGFFVAMLSISLGLSSIPNRAYLQIKESSHWVSVDKETFNRMSYFRDYPLLEKTDCKNEHQINEKNSGLNKNDIALMCKIMTDQGLGKYIERTIEEQRFILIFYMFFTLLFLPQIYKSILNYIKASEMKKRKKDRFIRSQNQQDDLSV